MTISAIGIKKGDGSDGTIYNTDLPVEGPQIGAVTETAPASDTASSGLNGRLQRVSQRLTSLIALFANGAGTASAALRTTLASDDPAVAALGSTSGAAVTTNASGTIQQYLRGLVTQWTAGTLVLGAGTNAIGKLAANSGVDIGDVDVASLPVSFGTGAATGQTIRTVTASDDPIVAAITRTVTTATASYTRPADTTAYASGDCLSNSTSAPTAGGLTFTVASANGKGGLITDLLVTSSNAPGTPLQGELWLFDTAPTAVNDNAAFTVSDSEILTLVAKVPFALTTIGANSQAHVQGLNIGYTTVSATTLRGLVMVTNAYTPASGEVVSFRLKTTPIG